ncbi:MAG: RIP metalloprotease RseP, partial [Pelagibacteraceae bacterium]|nr:RIP metalloprotease RseP [Pelagibacteraceae bacterium]
EKSGLKKNDIIVSIDKNKVESILEVSTYINTASSDKVNIKVLRNQKEIIVLTEPTIIEAKDAFGNSVKKKIIGIKYTPINNQFNKEKLGPTKAIYYSIKETWFVSKTIIKVVGSYFKGRGDVSQLGGPIKIVKISGKVLEFGIVAFFSVMAYISINLGLINLFPIPLLDGGHLMFFLFEKILGRPLKRKTQEGFFRIGLFLLLSLMIFATFNDLKDPSLFQ